MRFVDSLMSVRDKLFLKVSKVEASDSRDMHDDNVSKVDNGYVMSTSQHRLTDYSVWDSHVFILITMKQIV